MDLRASPMTSGLGKRRTMPEKIERQQFGGWDRALFPQFDNAEYLEYERVSTGLSSGIITFGYVALTPIGGSEKGHHYRWLKLADVPAENRRS